MEPLPSQPQPLSLQQHPRLAARCRPPFLRPYRPNLLQPSRKYTVGSIYQSGHCGRYAEATMASRSAERLSSVLGQLVLPSPVRTDAGHDGALTADELATFQRDGCLIVRGLVAGDALARLQAAFAAQQAETRAEWAARTADSWHADGYFDLHRPLERDRSYCELLATPKLGSLLKAAVGDDAHVVALQARTVPASGDRKTYTAWHTDTHEPGGAPAHPTICASAKLFVQVFDHTAETGCTAVVPGSRSDARLPGDVLAPDADPGDMPGHVQFTGKAGDAMLMDLSTWHGAIPSTLTNPATSVGRAGLIIQASPSKDKQEGFISESAARADDRGWVNTPVLRQLLGFGAERYGGPDFPPHTWRPRELAPLPAVLQRPTPVACPEQDVQTQAEYFREHGFCIIRGLLRGEALAAMQDSFRAVEPAAREAWERSSADDFAAKQLAISGSFRADAFFDWSVDPAAHLECLCCGSWWVMMSSAWGWEAGPSPRTMLASRTHAGIVTTAGRLLRCMSSALLCTTRSRR